MRPDMRARYLGLDLPSPIVASASPLAGNLDALRELEDAGAGAVVLPSLFEEQIEHEEMELDAVLETGALSHPEASSYFPELEAYNTGPTLYLKHLERAAATLRIPVIASLNGHSRGGWVSYARMMEDAGAAALELNAMFVPTSREATGAEVEARHLELVTDVRAATRVPLAVKIGPYFSSLPDMAARLVAAGAAGLVLFNRFLEPDIDLESLTVVPRLRLSTDDEVRLPLRWIAILRDQLDASLAATSGIHNAGAALKVLLAGADVAMMTSALLKHGTSHVRTVVAGIEAWLTEMEYESVAQLRGSMSRLSVPEPGAYERANYMKAITGYRVRRS